MTEEAEQQKFYLVTTAMPGPVDECAFVEVETGDGKDLGLDG